MIIKKENDLVDLEDYDNTLIIELTSYTSKNTPFGKTYKTNKAYAKKRIAEKLFLANKIAKQYGYRIKVCEAYRPYSITEMDSEQYPKLVEKGLLAPITGSWHNAGYALDITLVDNKDYEIAMPSKIHDFDSCYNFVENDNSTLLKKIMNEAGFGRIKTEWWHFQDIFSADGHKLELGSEEAPLYDFDL